MKLLQVILPVIIMLIIGMISREKKLISEEGISDIGNELYPANLTVLHILQGKHQSGHGDISNHTFRGDSRGNLRWETYM